MLICSLDGSNIASPPSTPSLFDSSHQTTMNSSYPVTPADDYTRDSRGLPGTTGPGLGGKPRDYSPGGHGRNTPSPTGHRSRAGTSPDAIDDESEESDSSDSQPRSPLPFAHSTPTEV
jgi:hypothetical protein